MHIIKHFKTITYHKWLVLKGCFAVGLYKQGLCHDLSKYMPSEFLVGANGANAHHGVHRVVSVTRIKLAACVGGDKSMLFVIYDNSPCDAESPGDLPDSQKLLVVRHKNLLLILAMDINVHCMISII